MTDLERPFNDVFQALDLKAQRKAMRSAMRREGKRLKAEAANNIQTSKLTAPGKTWKTGKRKRQYGGNAGDLKKGIRTRVYPERYGTGFLLTVKPHGRSGRDPRIMHVNRQGKMKPILMWAEDGTRYRKVGNRKSSFFSKSRFTGRAIRNYIRGGHSTGRMRRYGFIRKTDGQAERTVEENLFKDFQENLDRAARKKGLL